MYFHCKINAENKRFSIFSDLGKKYFIRHEYKMLPMLAPTGTTYPNLPR